MDFNQSLRFKLDEAKYFLDKMIQNEEERNKKVFAYYLSAFTSASRSVLQYVEEHENRFYQLNIRLVTLKEEFKKIRDGNIHEKPITTNNRGFSSIGTEITVPGEVVSSEEVNSKESSSPVNKYYYSAVELSDGYNTDSIVELGQNYIDEIEILVADFINGNN